MAAENQSTTTMSLPKEAASTFTTTALSTTTFRAFTTTSRNLLRISTSTTSAASTAISISSTSDHSSTSASIIPPVPPSSTSTSSLSTESSSRITLISPSTSTSVVPSTTLSVSTSTTLSLPGSSIFTTASPTSSLPANITIAHPTAHSNTPVIIGITVGSTIALLLLLAIAGIWYSHIRSRNQARREEEHEMATNSQGTFISGYDLNQKRAQKLAQRQPTLPNLSSYAENAQVETPKVKTGGLRRSNTREDGRRNRLMLQVTNPDPAFGAIQAQSHEQTFGAGEHNRARFDAWKRAQGLHQHTAGAATQYHRSSFSEVLSFPSSSLPVQPVHAPVQNTPVSQTQTEQEHVNENVEIISSGVQRTRSKLDSWKKGEVSPISGPIPEVRIIAPTPRIGTFEAGTGNGEGKELRTFLLSNERPVSRGPATFESMGLKESKKGLAVEKTPRSVEDK